MGVDSAPLAIRKAQEKAKARGLAVHFLVGDALDLASLDRTFDTVTDSGLFHTLSDEDRPVFEKSLASILPPGGIYFMLCFSDRETPRVRSEEDSGKGDSGELLRAGRQLPPAGYLREPHPGRRAPCLALIDNKKMMDGFSAVRL